MLKTGLRMARKLLDKKKWQRFPQVIQIDTNNYCGPTFCKGTLCTYCHVAGTMVLNVDMKWIPIETLNPGDYVVGFEASDRWRYVPSRILYTFNRESEVVKLETDKVNTICTPDHKWMIDNSSHDHAFRATKDFIVGQKIPFINLPVIISESSEYKRGWLSGIIRGDGCVQRYSRERLNGVHEHNGIKVYHRKEGSLIIHEQKHSIWTNSWNRGRNSSKPYFRLAVKDQAIIDRFLAYSDIDLSSYTFKSKTGNLIAIQSVKESINNFIKTFYEMRDINYEFNRGFLGGIFDAEGSFSSGDIIRISNTDNDIIRDICKAFTICDFKFIEEDFGRIKAVRLLGGKLEHIRFFSLTQPSLTRKYWKIYGKTLHQDPATVLSIQPTGKAKVYNITTTTGNYIANGLISKNCYPQWKIKNGERKYTSMPTDTIEMILDQVGRYGKTEMDLIDFFLNGDGFTEPRLPELHKYAKKQVPNAITQTFTNGIRWENYEAALALDRVCFTISAHMPKLYEIVHGSDCLMDALKGLRLVLDNRRENQRVEVHCVLTKDNIPYTKDWWGFFGEKYPDAIRILSPLVASYDNLPSKEAMGNYTLDDMEKIVIDVAGSEGRMWTRELIPDQKPCVLADNFSIDVEGWGLQCCNWAPPKESSYGNVFTMEQEGINLKDMWRRRLANRFTSKLCQSCNMKSPYFDKRVAAMKIQASIAN